MVEHSFKWKKVSVPNSYVKTVKAQQWAIINGDEFEMFGPKSPL